MGKIWMLASANIKESKGQSSSLVCLVFIAALLLNLGLLISINFINSFDLKAEQLKSPNVNVMMLQSVYQDSYLSYLNSYPGVTATQFENVLLLLTTGFKYDNGSQSKGAVMMNASNEREIMNVSFIGETLTVGENSIYVPYLLQTGGGYSLGDDFTLTYAGKEYQFQIAGFTEDIAFSTINSSQIGFYLPESVYNRFAKEINDETVAGMLISVVLEEQVDAAKLIYDFKETQISSDDIQYVVAENIEFVRSARTLTAGIASMIIVAIAIVIVFVGLIVIRFRIDNSIEDGMVNIGALKACGYTSRQIIGFITLQFSLLTFLGTVLGIGSSYLIIPLLSDIFSVQSGLIWEQGFDPLVSFFGLFIILFVVLIVSWLSSNRVNHLHPIIALRSGLKTHNFRVNRFPLDKTKGNLHTILSLKRFAQNPKQNGSIVLIITVVCFVAVLGLIMYYNFVVSNGAVKLIFGECPDVQVKTSTNTENSTLLNDIADMPGVRKAIYYDYAACFIEYHDVYAYVTEDFEQTESDMLYEGRHPKHSNEIGLNGYLAELLGKKIGDTVTVERGNIKEEYLVTGLYQTSNMLGMDMELTESGILRLQPDFQRSFVYIYLSDDKDVKDFIGELENQDDERISNIQDFEEFIGTFINSYASIVRVLVAVVMVIIIMVIILILYLVIKTMILREKRTFGIQKAVGYTTQQLMSQIAMTFLPVVSVGVILGGFIGYFATNPLLSVIFKSIGIMKISFVISPFLVVVLSGCIVLLSYFVSMLVAWRIRKISAYALITE